MSWVFHRAVTKKCSDSAGLIDKNRKSMSQLFTSPVVCVSYSLAHSSCTTDINFLPHKMVDFICMQETDCKSECNGVTVSR